MGRRNKRVPTIDMSHRLQVCAAKGKGDVPTGYECLPCHCQVQHSTSHCAATIALSLTVVVLHAARIGSV